MCFGILVHNNKHGKRIEKERTNTAKVKNHTYKIERFKIRNILYRNFFNISVFKLRRSVGYSVIAALDYYTQCTIYTIIIMLNMFVS